MGFLDSHGLARFKAKIDTLIAGKLAKNQGASNAGLFMKINTDGELIPGPVPDPTGKADKVSRATSGNFAGLDTNGNLTDSGSKASDFLLQSQGVANAGKIVKVNDSGYLALAEADEAGSTEIAKILEAQSGIGLTLAQVTEDGQQVWRWCYDDGT